MSDNGFQKLETEIPVQAKREELIERFPVMMTDEIVEVFMDGDKIYEEVDPYSRLYTLLEAIKQRKPGRIGYVKSKRPYKYGSCIKIGEGRYDVRWAKENTCNVVVRSYDKDLEQHYQSVDIIRAYLEQAGFVVGSGKCEVTRKIRC